MPYRFGHPDPGGEPRLRRVLADYLVEFRYDRRPVGTLQGADSDRVALAGSLSKTLSPALGLGWLVTPHRWTGPIRAVPRGAPGVLDQLGLAEFIESGGYDRHLRGAQTVPGPTRRPARGAGAPATGVPDRWRGRRPAYRAGASAGRGT